MVRRQRVAARGWPAEIPPREADILDYLWTHGPSTRRAIYEGIGMRWAGPHWSGGCNPPLALHGRYTTYLQDLIDRGMVIYLGRIVSGRGKGGNIGLYSLPLTIQKGIAHEEEHGDHADGGRGDGARLGHRDAPGGHEAPDRGGR